MKLTPEARRRFWRWSVPFAAVAAAAFLRAALAPWLGENIPYGPFFLAIAASALFAGFMPALLATFLGALAADWFFVPPLHSLSVANQRLAASLIFFCAIGCSISALGYLVQRKKKELQIAHERLEQVVQLLDLASVMIMDLNGRITRWNTGSANLYGYGPEAAQGRTAHSLLQTRFPEPLDDIRAKLLEKGRWEGELVHTAADGRQVIVVSEWTLWRNASGSPEAILEVNTDITERKRTEQALRESERNYRIVAENTDAWEFWEKPGGGFLYNSPSCARVTGYDRQEFTNDPGLLSRIIHPDDRALYEVHRGTPDEICTSEEVEFRIIRKDGKVRWIAHLCRPVYDLDGQFLGMRGSNRDITQRKEAEEELRRSEEWFRVALEASDTGWWHWDLVNDQLEGDQRVRALFDLPPDAELTFEWLLAHTAEADRQVLIDRVSQLRSTSGDAEVEFRVLHGDGTAHWVLTKGRSFAEPDGAPGHAMGIAFDISDRKHAEAALQQSEFAVRRKLSSILSPEGDIGTLELGDLIDIEEIGALMQSFYAASGVPVSIVDLKGKLLFGAGWQDICTKFHRVHPEAAKCCIESDTLLSAGVQPGEFKLYKCRNNMWDVATPVMIGGVHVANIFSGQFFFEDEPPDYDAFRLQAKRYGFAEDEYLRMLDAVPRISRRQLQQAMNFYMKLAHVLSQSAFSTLKLARTLEQRKLAEKEAAKSRRLLAEAEKLSHTGAWEWDLPAGKWRFSEEWLEIHGCRKAPASIDELLPLAHAEDLPLIRQAFESAAAGRSNYDIEHRIINQTTGEVRTVQARGQYVADAAGKVIKIYGFAQDITERKRLREKLHAAIVSAERAKAAAEHANAAKDQFLAVLSHELRTPLAPVLAGIALMERKQCISCELRDTWEIIRRNIQLQARLIDDLLDLTKIARGKVVLERKPMKVETAIERVLDICRPNIEGRKQRLQVHIEDAPLVVVGDIARLQQVFWNLLSNSIKFTPDGGDIAIRCFAEDHNVIVQVTDTGIGMEPEALVRVFSAFEQADQLVTRQFGGLGLGLAISQRLVEMHGGTITAESPGKQRGATFRVVLPAAAANIEQSQPPAALQVENQYAGLRVLLVEDHADTALMTSELLRAAGFEVESAADAAQALEAASAKHFDLIISDLGLPDRSGVEMLQELRSRNNHIKAIALSGYGREEDVQRSKEAGFAAHLTKPVDFDSLLRTVTEVARFLPSRANAAKLQ